ncbi:hypothetical protein [Halomonas sp.]|uniref:hypothetical protein n=1 Tax=Halomonas sp. TaxID=1486246 RepID=UPI00384DDD5E
MLSNLFSKPIKVWVIKQIDDTTLHLCGQGTLESDHKRRKMLEALHAGRFEGGVRMGDSGIVVNTKRLAAVVPLEALRLLDDGNTAEWQGRRWAVSHVPQRGWAFDGPLVAEPNPAGGHPAWVSREDVAHIRRNVRHDVTHPGEVTFRPDNALEDPEKDMQASIEKAQRWRNETRKGWRKDGSWGPLDE